MEVILKRKYYPQGTNGKLYLNGGEICSTIELPWLDNRRNVSCIPEGTYEVMKRYAEKRGDHLILLEVPNRTGILIHPANQALVDLKGCIGPVTKLESPGIGSSSRKATEELQRVVFEALDRGEKVFITIQKDVVMNVLDRVKAPTPKFFKVLRNVGIALAAAGGAILASPIALPAGIMTLGGYLVAGGSVMGAVSQATVEDNDKFHV